MKMDGQLFNGSVSVIPNRLVHRLMLGTSRLVNTARLSTEIQIQSQLVVSLLVVISALSFNSMRGMHVCL